jgi:hypothetical protein
LRIFRRRRAGRDRSEADEARDRHVEAPIVTAVGNRMEFSIAGKGRDVSRRDEVQRNVRRNCPVELRS